MPPFLTLPLRATAAAFAIAAAVPGMAMAGGIPEPLTDPPGDAARGRAIVADRERGLCLLCHTAPIPEATFQGNLAPDLAGVGARLDVAALRLRMVDSRRIKPNTIMPPYHSTEGFQRVGQRWQGQPILTAQEVEDVVTYLTTLTEPRP